LVLPSEQPLAPLDLTVTDTNRHRDIPIRVYLPAKTNTAPVVLFSHGLGGNRLGSAYLGRHWAARGYVAVFLQHAGSDDGVWKNQPLRERNRAMRDAASGANFLLRVKDVPAVLDQLERWQNTTKHPLAGRLDLRRIGMSGHSFGAVTTQAVSGQAPPGGGQPLTDRRIKAAIAFSPSEPATGSPAQAFGQVTIPWLLMTGTKDVARLGSATIGASSVEQRLSVFPALPPGSKYEIVLNDAEHSAFTDRALPGETGRRNPNHHRAILALSTAFWDAYLKGDAAARAWLDGAGPRGVLETNDRWQTKRTKPFTEMNAGKESKR
jgi:predicted dienelactone hydrolase